MCESLSLALRRSCHGSGGLPGGGPHGGGEKGKSPSQVEDGSGGGLFGALHIVRASRTQRVEKHIQRQAGKEFADMRKARAQRLNGSENNEKQVFSRFHPDLPQQGFPVANVMGRRVIEADEDKKENDGNLDECEH